MNKIDDERLKPCPFCGEPAAIWYFPQHDRLMLKDAYYVGCTNDNCGCELEHPGAFKSLDDAVSAWNRRHQTLEQEPKTGHWVHGEYCSECGCDVPAYIIDWKWQKDMDAKYCPNCGAKMESEADNG